MLLAAVNLSPLNGPSHEMGGLNRVHNINTQVQQPILAATNQRCNVCALVRTTIHKLMVVVRMRVWVGLDLLVDFLIDAQLNAVSPSFEVPPHLPCAFLEILPIASHCFER